MTDVKELMAKVGKIRILTNKLIDDQLAGDYHSSFKGQGVEFDEVRPYLAGDDVRTIDWNVTAKTGVPYIKRFAEERELTILFLVDVSGSQGYGSVRRSKMELAAEATALLALTAIRNQDKIGLILFSDRIVKYIPPRKGRDSVMRLVREVLAAEDDAQGGTDVEGALKFLNGVQKRRAVVFLVSDFLGTRGDAKMLRAAARHHDLICVPVSDPAESALPDVGLVELEDPETGELVLADTSSASVRRAFAAQAERENEGLKKFFAKTGIETLPISTDRPYVDAVRRLFHRRARKRTSRFAGGVKAMAMACAAFFGMIVSSYATPTISDLKVTPVPPLGLAIDYTVSGAMKYDVERPIEVELTTYKYYYGYGWNKDSTYTAKNLVGETNCVNGVHRIYWNMAEDGLSVTASSNEVTVTYKYVVTEGARYCVIDLSGGSKTNHYPVTYLDKAPSGNEYKTTKLLLRRVDPGSFIMGEDQEEEANRVTLTQQFYLGVYEVTQKQWEQVMGKSACSASCSHGKGDAFPVHNVSYGMIRGSSAGAKWPESNSVDADSFLGKLRTKTGLDFDLPTEAQWEYACRAETTTAYCFGDSVKDDSGEDYMWYYTNSSKASHEVGTKDPNDWGFYDMHGNVWEWCLDWYASPLSVEEEEDPKGPSSGARHVTRGGCYSNLSTNCTSFARQGPDDTTGNQIRGFRLSRNLE